MKDPEIKTKVTHSESKTAWNVVGVTLGKKFKIARVPYEVTTIPEVNMKNRQEALDHANFISYCFNKSHKIVKKK